MIELFKENDKYDNINKENPNSLKGDSECNWADFLAHLVLHCVKLSLCKSILLTCFGSSYKAIA